VSDWTDKELSRNLRKKVHAETRRRGEGAEEVFSSAGTPVKFAFLNPRERRGKAKVVA